MLTTTLLFCSCYGMVGLLVFFICGWLTFIAQVLNLMKGCTHSTQCCKELELCSLGWGHTIGYAYVSNLKR